MPCSLNLRAVRRSSSISIFTLMLAGVSAACGGDAQPSVDAAATTADAGPRADATPSADSDAAPIANDATPGADDAAPANDAGPTDDAAIANDDAAVTSPDATAPPATVFHAWITPGALGVVTGGTISFTGTAVGGSGNYAYAWTFNGAPATATGAGPHPVVFNSATADIGALARIQLTATDVTTGDVWTQRVELPVSTVAMPGPPTVTLNPPATPTVTVEQGGAVEMNGTFTGPNRDYQSLFFFGDAATHSIVSGNINGAYASFPFTGTYAPRLIAHGYPSFESAVGVVSVTVTPEQPGTLATGMRLGPLQGVTGCYFCNAYVDNRIEPVLATNGARFLAVFDQLTKAVDADDSIIGAVFDGAWQPYVDLDNSTGRGVSLVGLGEGNPINAHQHDAHMAANGDAAVVFMQRTTSMNPMRNASQHVFANVLIGSTWTGPVQLDRSPDGGPNNYNAGATVITWREGNVTRALATWSHYTGLFELQYATFSSATMTWTAPIVLAGAEGGPLAVTPSGRVLKLWTTRDGVFAGHFEGGAWTLGMTPIFEPEEDVNIELATSADGTAMVLAGHDDDGVTNPVFAIRYDGSAWQAPVQIGGLSDIDAIIPDTLGTGYRYETVLRLELAMDDRGNALAAWVLDASSAMVRSLPIGVSSYYTAGAGWTPFVPWTRVVSVMEAEVFRRPQSSGESLKIGLDLSGTRGIVTYALSKNSQPRGSAADQLHYRHYDVTGDSWGPRQNVDTHPGHLHGHSQVALRADGSAMVVYEVFPAGADESVAGAVYGREIGP